jgi:hypothetical protein
VKQNEWRKRSAWQQLADLQTSQWLAGEIAKASPSSSESPKTFFGVSPDAETSTIPPGVGGAVVSGQPKSTRVTFKQLAHGIRTWQVHATDSPMRSVPNDSQGAPGNAGVPEEVK